MEKREEEEEQVEKREEEEEQVEKRRVGRMNGV